MMTTAQDDDDMIYAGEAFAMLHPLVGTARQFDTLVARGDLTAHQPTTGQWRTFRRGDVRQLGDQLREREAKGGQGASDDGGQ